MNKRVAALGWTAAVGLLAACASSPAPATASRTASTATVTASPTAPVAPVATATPSPTPTLPAVPDFSVVAYQGDEVFGGHDGHFAAAFAAGRPVVLLYFAGL
jgi:hypothetical protein